jgi:hypothetical protein
MIRMKQNPDISYGMRTRKLEKIESKLKWLSLESSQLIYNREQKNISVIYDMEGMKYMYMENGMQQSPTKAIRPKAKF